jgi:hypothetical protein
MNIILSLRNTSNDSNQPLLDIAGSIFFTEKKKNIIIDGTFTKLLYSTEYFTMSGLYIYFRICSKFVTDVLPKDKVPGIMHDGGKDQSNHKTYIQFNPTTEYNHAQIESMCELERYILHVYSKTQRIHCEKTPIYGLQTQLYSGCIRTHSEPVKSVTRRSFVIPERDAFLSPLPDSTEEDTRSLDPNWIRYIKISGVWETDQAYGITYKVIYS